MADARTGAAAKRPITSLNELFIRSLKALGEAGQTDLACRLAGEGWKELNPYYPADAERLNGALHWLTRPKEPATSAVSGSPLGVQSSRRQS